MKQLLSCLDRGGERQGQTHRYRETRTDTPSETGKNRCTERDGQTGRDAPKETGTDVPRGTDRNRCTERDRDIIMHREGQTTDNVRRKDSERDGQTGTDVPRKPRTDAPSETRTEAPRKTD